MNFSFRFLFLGWLMLAITACGVPISTPDPATAKFVALSEQAKQIARKEIPNAVLLQVDADLNRRTFRFSDTTGTKAIHITVPSPNAPSSQWTTAFSPKFTLPAPVVELNIKDLRLSPNQVAQMMMEQWSDCRQPTMTLYRNDKINQLAWLAYCNTPQGIVRGEINDFTGALKPHNVSVTPVPVTATPKR